MNWNKHLLQPSTQVSPVQDNLAGHRILRASERAGDGAPPGGHEQGAGAGQGLQRRRRVKDYLVQERNHG